MAKSELGTKRICPTTGKKFYDLNKSPVISPYTGEVVPIAPPTAARGRAAAAAAASEDAPEAAEMETVSLEEADAEATGKVKSDLPESEDDIEVDDIPDDEDDDSTFIAEEEEGDDDVTDIIGDVSDDEES